MTDVHLAVVTATSTRAFVHSTECKSSLTNILVYFNNNMRRLRWKRTEGPILPMKESLNFATFSRVY